PGFPRSKAAGEVGMAHAHGRIPSRRGTDVRVGRTRVLAGLIALVFVSAFAALVPSLSKPSPLRLRANAGQQASGSAPDATLDLTTSTGAETPSSVTVTEPTRSTVTSVASSL